MQLDNMSDMDLVRLSGELRRFPEDKELLEQVLIELGRRQKYHLADDQREVV